MTTGAAGSSATVTNSGSSSAATFDFAIPRGDTGATGPQGPAGSMTQMPSPMTNRIGVRDAKHIQELHERRLCCCRQYEHGRLHRPGSTTATVIGLTVANITTSQITVDVKLITSSGDDTFILKAAPVPVGSGIVPIGGDQKLVMETGDILRVISSAANSADSTVSVLEIS